MHHGEVKGSGGIASLTVNLVTESRSGKLHAPATLPPGKSAPVPTEYEAGWAPERA